MARPTVSSGGRHHFFGFIDEHGRVVIQTKKPSIATHRESFSKPFTTTPPRERFAASPTSPKSEPSSVAPRYQPILSHHPKSVTRRASNIRGPCIQFPCTSLRRRPPQMQHASIAVRHHIKILNACAMHNSRYFNGSPIRIDAKEYRIRIPDESSATHPHLVSF